MLLAHTRPYVRMCASTPCVHACRLQPTRSIALLWSPPVGRVASRAACRMHVGVRCVRCVRCVACAALYACGWRTPFTLRKCLSGPTRPAHVRGRTHVPGGNPSGLHTSLV